MLCRCCSAQCRAPPSLFNSDPRSSAGCYPIPSRSPAYRCLAGALLRLTHPRLCHSVLGHALSMHFHALNRPALPLRGPAIQGSAFPLPFDAQPSHSTAHAAKPSLALPLRHGACPHLAAPSLSLALSFSALSFSALSRTAFAVHRWALLFRRQTMLVCSTQCPGVAVLCNANPLPVHPYHCNAFAARVRAMRRYCSSSQVKRPLPLLRHWPSPRKAP